MTNTFYKYHGTGNDFMLIDDRKGEFKADKTQIAAWCARRFGVGADGLILLQSDVDADFKMKYFNADGQESTMCGNGGRCIVQFAKHLGVINFSCTFVAIDGRHDAKIADDGMIHLKMNNTVKAAAKLGGWFIDTGSPHHITKVPEVKAVDVENKGRTLRNDYGTAGCNINFVEVDNGQLHVRTYERGVESETLSCGTGVTAAALTAYQLGLVSEKKIVVNTPGGKLNVEFEQNSQGFENIWLIGPAQLVFKGELPF